MNQVTRGLIIGGSIVAGLLLLAFIGFYSQELLIEKLAEGESGQKIQKGLEESALKTAQQACAKMTREIEEANNCSRFRNSDDRDMCYYCFAFQKQDLSLCENINDKFRADRCRNEITSSP